MLSTSTGGSEYGKELAELSACCSANWILLEGD